MTYRMEAHELPTITEDRRQLAVGVRKLASLLESQEPDYLVLHDAWEDLLELAEQTNGHGPSSSENSLRKRLG